jgi:hypothetical protein
LIFIEVNFQNIDSKDFASKTFEISAMLTEKKEEGLPARAALLYISIFLILPSSGELTCRDFSTGFEVCFVWVVLVLHNVLLLTSFFGSGLRMEFRIRLAGANSFPRSSARDVRLERRGPYEDSAGVG